MVSFGRPVKNAPRREEGKLRSSLGKSSGNDEKKWTREKITTGGNRRQAFKAGPKSLRTGKKEQRSQTNLEKQQHGGLSLKPCEGKVLSGTMGGLSDKAVKRRTRRGNWNLQER